MSSAGLAVYVNFIMEMNFPDVITCLVLLLRWNRPFHTSPKPPGSVCVVYGKVAKTNKHDILSNAIKGFICPWEKTKK